MDGEEPHTPKEGTFKYSLELAVFCFKLGWRILWIWMQIKILKGVDAITQKVFHYQRRLRRRKILWRRWRRMVRRLVRMRRQ